MVFLVWLFWCFIFGLTKRPFEDELFCLANPSSGSFRSGLLKLFWFSFCLSGTLVFDGLVCFSDLLPIQ